MWALVGEVDCVRLSPWCDVVCVRVRSPNPVNLFTSNLETLEGGELRPIVPVTSACSIEGGKSSEMGQLLRETILFVHCGFRTEVGFQKTANLRFSMVAIFREN